MSDSKSTTSAYTRLEISHPYLLFGDDQFALLDDNMDRNVIQYDHMYVQTTHMLLFRWTNENCYINIVEHAAANVITSTCDFLYYHKTTVHTTLVNTKDFFYLLNIQDKIKITCGKYNHEAVSETHSVSIIKWKDLYDCVIQTFETQLIGSQSNCSSNRNFIIYHTFNFVMEWLYNKLTMPYYSEKSTSCVCQFKPASLLSMSYSPSHLMSLPKVKYLLYPYIALIVLSINLRRKTSFYPIQTRTERATCYLIIHLSRTWMTIKFRYRLLV